jgi:hypothetical protein
LATGQASLVSGYHQYLEKWNTAWKLDAIQLRELYGQVADILIQDNQHVIALTYLAKYFDTFPANAPLPADASSKAQNIIVKTLKMPIALFNERTALLRVMDIFL